MRHFLLAVVAVSLAVPAAGQDLSGRAFIGFQHYEFGSRTQSGFRQSYDLGFSRAFSGNTRFRIFVRADQFDSTDVTSAGLRENSDSRQFQPIAELAVLLDTIRLQLRTDYLDYRGGVDRSALGRVTERTFGSFRWEPVALPSVEVNVQRNANRDRATMREVSDEGVSGRMDYVWRGLTTGVESRWIRSADPTAGYERTMGTNGGHLGYAASLFAGRLSVAAHAGAQRSEISELVTNQTSARVPVPIPLLRVLYGVDETPLDDRDQPLVSYPSLKDGNINVSSGIALGPQSASFQNIAFEIGRAEPVDQIRLIVRDDANNPLTRGGGPITWDAYVSEDGHSWAPLIDAMTTFDSVLSMYVVDFEQITTRWVKVVSFGVNSEPTFLTEAQAYYHATIRPGEAGSGTQETRNAMLSASFRPFRRLTISYSGGYSALDQAFAARAGSDNVSVDHSASVVFDAWRQWSLRAEASRSDIRTLAGTGDGLEMTLAALDYSPTKRLRMSVEASRQSQALFGIESTIETQAVRLYGSPLRSIHLSFDAGVQSQTSGGAEIAERTFITFSSNARVTPTSRLMLSATIQRSDSRIDDPATLLLGASRDDRIYAEYIWQPGRPLLVSVRVGWLNSVALSGLTHRVRAEWSPFAGGAVSLTAYFDEDVDPISDRRASRLVFNPRWRMNRHLMFDVNYTAIETDFQGRGDEQKTLLAAFTVTK